MAIVHVCMDSHNGNEPSATPTVHVAVSTWGLQSVQSFFELVWAPHGIDFVKLISVLAWHGVGSSTRNAAFGALVEQPEMDIIQKIADCNNEMKRFWIGWAHMTSSSESETQLKYNDKLIIIRSYEDLVFNQKIYVNAMGMMETFYAFMQMLSPGWSHWLDPKVQNDHGMRRMWELFATLHRLACIHLCACHRSLRTTTRTKHRRPRPDWFLRNSELVRE